MVKIKAKVNDNIIGAVTLTGKVPPAKPGTKVLNAKDFEKKLKAVAL